MLVFVATVTTNIECFIHNVTLDAGGTYFDVRGELGRNERCTILVTRLVTVELKSDIAKHHCN